MKVIMIVLLMLATIGQASAYSVPAEHKNTSMVEVDLYALAMEHQGEPWADYILNDIRYKHQARNIEKFNLEMAYQATLPRLRVNNLVVENN